MLPKITNYLFLDFETYYHAATYTLRKMTVPEYLLDARYEMILCAVAANGAPSSVVDGPDFDQWIAQFDPAVTATVTFNSLFDNALLAWRHGWVPALMLDSMNIARATRGHILQRLNLETVVKGVLGRTRDKSTILKMSGKHRADVLADPPLWDEFCRYACQDNDDSRDIFKKLFQELPPAERQLMDLVIRCAVQPRFQLDSARLKAHLAALTGEKVRLLNACGAKLPANPTKAALKFASTSIGLMSTAGFAKVLDGLSVEVEYKRSPTGGPPIPQFAKTDPFMEKLLAHPDHRVQVLAAARLNAKSTIEESRVEKLIALAALDHRFYRDGNGGNLPVPLMYAGAHTHRLSGTWRLNLQNLPAGRAGKTNELRKSLIAGPGELVIAGDLSQIEARLVAWLAKCAGLMREFSIPGGDPYSAFASIVFGFQVNKKLNPMHRFIGKTGVLGLGYQCGWRKFYYMVAMLARLQGIDLAAAGIQWTPELAERTVRGYRTRYHEIQTLWNMLQAAVEQIWCVPGPHAMKVGPVTIRYGEVEGPNGLKMKYHNPHVQMSYGDHLADFQKRQFVYQYGWGHYHMYGGKMLENIIQFLARIIIMNAALRLNDLGYRFLLQAHDELVFIVPEKQVDIAKQIIHRELVRRPSWAPDLPLEAEVHSGPTYGDCK